MNFEAGKIYHIYNRSFEKATIFLTEDNYMFFIKKLFSLNSACDVLAYCLMPNHFHILIYIPDRGEKALSAIPSMQALTRKIGTILSSYTQAFNKQRKRTGSLFQPKTKSKELTDKDYPFICFHYIHQNPLKANLVSKLENWKHSSFNEYYTNRAGVCNKNRAIQLLDLPLDQELFYKQSYQVMEIDINFEQ